MEAFIESVRKYPCLWNPLHPNYREIYLKDEAWQIVVDTYNNSSIPNIQTAKIEWKKLRDNHRDALKRAKLGKNKLLPAQITTWKYAKAMQFLEPHMKYRITENIEMDPLIGPGGKLADSNVSTSEKAESTRRVEPLVKRRCVEPLVKRRCIEASPVKFRQNSDALESFFNCMLKSARDMPTWMQTQVKKKIFAVIIEAEEYLSNQGQCNSADSFVKNQNDDIIDENKVKTEIFSEEDSCD